MDQVKKCKPDFKECEPKKVKGESETSANTNRGARVLGTKARASLPAVIGIV